MWARHMELALGLWLAIGPLVFRADGSFLRERLGAALIVALALASHAARLRCAHLAQLPVAGALIATGWLAGDRLAEVPPPLDQNAIVVGLLLAMFSIVPSAANVPPRARSGGTSARSAEGVRRPTGRADRPTDGERRSDDD
ncbi:MAG: hypothetical protein R3F35_23525 [Myxococcota bacterium]